MDPQCTLESVSTKLQGVHIKMDPKMVRELKALAKKKGLPYQTFMKLLLREALDELKTSKS